MTSRQGEARAPVSRVAGARANGIEAVAVLWGYGSPRELHAAGPDRIVASMAELREHVRRAPSRRP